MTCKQVRALMNALPLAEYPRAQLEAAERHARNCRKCTPVVTSSKALDLQLSRLPEPPLPAGLEAAILERIALQGRAVAPLSGADSVSAVIKQERFSLAAALTGLAASLGVLAYWLVDGRAQIDLTSSRIGGATMDIIHMPGAFPAFLVLAVGLLIYVTGLIVPLFGPGSVSRNGAWNE
ncbi:MAG: hypothetical protein LAP85_25300 [Acidobacteriia bacterium]|nr:hypothetical protein [Terriglobia bacterium]